MPPAAAAFRRSALRSCSDLSRGRQCGGGVPDDAVITPDGDRRRLRRRPRRTPRRGRCRRACAGACKAAPPRTPPEAGAAWAIIRRGRRRWRSWQGHIALGTPPVISFPDAGKAMRQNHATTGEEGERMVRGCYQSLVIARRRVESGPCPARSGGSSLPAGYLQSRHGVLSRESEGGGSGGAVHPCAVPPRR